ncbi:hypothetical protein C8J57DRAFT_1727988 [Mycena rebaudengoi]|nr:hypothetical protein C8J57DRAFT_1727988 [Mycena rebaudengoi]
MTYILNLEAVKPQKLGPTHLSRFATWRTSCARLRKLSDLRFDNDADDLESAMLRVLERNDMNGMSKEKVFFAKSADSDDKEEDEEEEEEEPASKKPRRSGADDADDADVRAEAKIWKASAAMKGCTRPMAPSSMKVESYSIVRNAGDAERFLTGRLASANMLGAVGRMMPWITCGGYDTGCWAKGKQKGRLGCARCETQTYCSKEPLGHLIPALVPRTRPVRNKFPVRGGAVGKGDEKLASFQGSARLVLQYSPNFQRDFYLVSLRIRVCATGDAGKSAVRYGIVREHNTRLDDELLREETQSGRQNTQEALKLAMSIVAWGSALGAVIHPITLINTIRTSPWWVLALSAANHTAHSVHPNYLVALSTVQQSMSEILYFILVVFPGLVPLMQLMALVSFAFVVATHIAVGQKL